METLIALQVEESPEHSVLLNASKYDIRELRFHWLGGGAGATLELEVSTHTDYVVLRFHGVEELRIPGGTLISSMRLKIQDTSRCPSASHNIPPVRVGGIIDSGNVLQFWARSVERVKR